MNKTVEQYEIEITRLKAALVTVSEQANEMVNMPQKELKELDHKRIYQSISTKALRGKP